MPLHSSSTTHSTSTDICRTFFFMLPGFVRWCLLNTAGKITSKDRPETTALRRSPPTDFVGIIRRSWPAERLTHHAPPWLCTKNYRLMDGFLHVYRPHVRLFHHPKSFRSHHSIRFRNCLITFRVPNFKSIEKTNEDCILFDACLCGHLLGKTNPPSFVQSNLY